MSVLRLDTVRIALGERELLTLSAEASDTVPLTIMGPSGSGKSSLLAWLAGFLAPTFAASGTATLNGTELMAKPPEARQLGLLFQDPLLFPHMSVAGNLLFGMRTGGSRSERMATARDALLRIDLDGFADRDPDTLSGGQKARVALMRVLLAQPRALLLDEPFSKLDMSLRRSMRDLVFEQARAQGLPVILVTHDEADAEAAGGTLITL